MTTIIAEDCTERCRSLQHGKEINIIITKHGRSDEEVLALMKKTCKNFHKIKDEFNRNALHLAASTGRQKLVEWLIKREGCDINAKDSSGYTALHRSIFFGQIHVTRTLLKLGALINISDNEGYFPLDLIRLDRPKYITNDDKAISEAYVWGLNENYNLGTGTETPRNLPELVDRMRKLPWGHLGSCFSQIAMSPFHTLWLHWSSEVYSCGLGTSGQLGLDTTTHAFTPKRIEFRSTERCVQVATALEHSLFRMETGAVKSCGSNEYFVLGHKQASAKVLKPKAVDITCKTEFICASKFHSIFLAKNEIYVCGTNMGQMGFDESIKSIVKPRKMTLPFEKEDKKEQEGQFTHVDCNEWATVVCHSRGYICIFKKYRCVTLNTRHFDIQKIQVVGGGVDTDAGYSNDFPICVFILLKHGRLLIWHENQEQLFSSSSSSSNSKKTSSSSSSPQFTIAIFNVGRALTITDFCVNTSSLILINQGGESFKASLNLRSNPVLIPNIHASSSSSNNTSSGEWGFQVKESMRHQIGKDLFSFMPLELFKVKRINNIYSALKTYCDCRGNNFAITQVHQKADLLNLPQKMKTTMNADLGLLLKETSMDDDIHDVTFKVGNFLFPAHRFIIASTCEVLYREVKKKCEEIEESSSDQDMTSSSSSQVIVTIKNVEPRIFELILQFLYSNQCDIFIPGHFKVYENDPDWPELLRIYAKKLQLRSLIERLHSCNVRMNNGQIEMSRIINANSVSNIKFDKNSWISLSDVNLISEDGHEVKAHQCILVARLEYYKNMLQRNFWFEGSRTSNEQQLKFPGPKSVMDIFLDIIYRGDYSHTSFGGKKELEILTQALVTSDLLLSPEFLSHFEYLITDYISQENASQLLHLSCICNAQQLKLGCIEFICLNLAPILENRLLDGLPDEQMKEIARYYKSNFAEVLSRKLDDISAPHDDFYTAAAEELAEDIELLDHIEDLDFITPKKIQSSKGKLKMRNRTLSSSSANNDNNDSSSNSVVDKTRVDSTEYYTDNDGHHHDHDWSNYDSSFEEFTVVSKSLKTSNGQQKQRSPPPPPTKTSTTTPKISIPLPSHSFNLSTKNQTQFEAQQQSVSLGTGFSPKSILTTKATAVATNKITSTNTSRQTNQIAFNENDFPSFGDVIVNNNSSLKSDSHHHSDNVSTTNKNTCKILNSGQRKSNGLTNNQHGEIQSNSNNIINNVPVNPSSSTSKRKTKWVNLEKLQSSSKSSTIKSSNDSSTISSSSGRNMNNPWQKLNTPEKSCLNDESLVKFDEIVQREQQKKENLEKVKAKPLLFHQIEDEAINYLWERFGKTEDVLNGYELVKVERVSKDYAVPIWEKNV